MATQTEREFRLIVPRTDNSGNLIRTSVFQDVAQTLTNRFNGVTIYPRVGGCFRNDSGGIDCDLSVEFQVVVQGPPAQLQAAQQFMVGLATRLGNELGQESMFEQQDLASRTQFVPTKRAPAAAPELQSGQKISRTPEALIRRLIQGSS